MFTTENLIFCSGQARTVLLPYDFFLVRGFGEKTVGDITTILGFFMLIFNQNPCSACGEKLSAFFVLGSTGAATISPCQSSMALKSELSEYSYQTSIWPSQEGHNTGAPFQSHESGGSSGSTVSNGLRSLLAFT